MDQLMSMPSPALRMGPGSDVPHVPAGDLVTRRVLICIRRCGPLSSRTLVWRFSGTVEVEALKEACDELVALGAIRLWIVDETTAGGVRVLERWYEAMPAAGAIVLDGWVLDVADIEQEAS